MEETKQESRVAVLSPCDLRAGFVFVAKISGQQFRVTVPESVKQGEIFEIAIPCAPDSTSTTNTTTTTTTTTNSDDALTGQWKDGIMDCFRYGPVHPSICNAMCCPQLLMTQLSNRLNIDSSSKVADTTTTDSNNNATGSTPPSSYKRATTLLLFACLLDLLLIAPCLEILGVTSATTVSGEEGDGNGEEGVSSLLQGSTIAIQLFYLLWSFALTFLAIWSVVKLRAAVRAKHNIPQAFPLEDVCCVVCCHCCTLAQLSRQTADYDVEAAHCCTADGLVGSKRINLCMDL